MSVGRYEINIAGDSNLLAEVWDAMFIERWYAESPLARITNPKVIEKLKGRGQLIHFRKDPEATIVPHLKDQPIQWAGLSAEQTIITVDYAFSGAHRVDEIDLSQLDVDYMGKIANSITKKHAEKEAEVFFSIAPTLSYNPLNLVDRSGLGVASNLRADGARYIINQFAAFRTALNRRRVPKQGRFIAVSPEVEELLITSDQATYNVAGVQNKEIETGEWGLKICGMDIVVTEFVPGDGSTGNPYLCIGGWNQAVGFGRQVTKVEANVQLQDYYGKGVRALNVFGAGLLYSDGFGLVKVRTT